MVKNIQEYLSVFYQYNIQYTYLNLGLYTKEEQPTVQECTTCIGRQAFKHASRQVAIVQTRCFLGTRLCYTKKIRCHSSFSLPTPQTFPCIIITCIHKNAHISLHNIIYEIQKIVYMQIILRIG